MAATIAWSDASRLFCVGLPEGECLYQQTTDFTGGERQHSSGNCANYAGHTAKSDAKCKENSRGVHEF